MPENHPQPKQYQFSRFAMLGIFILFAFLFMTYGSERETAVSATNLSQQTLATTAQQSKLFLPAILNRYDTVPGHPIFGVQMYGNTLPSNKYYNDLVESSANWVRIPVHWRDAEPTLQNPKNYNWSAIDATLSAARPNYGNVQIIGTVYYAPDWAVPEPYHPRAVLKDEALPHFGQFVQALAARYSGNTPGLPVVTHWEFYNEPDIATEPGGVPLWGDSGHKYAQMLATVSPAIKAGNPNAKVVFGGIAYDAFTDQGGTFVRKFLDDVLTAGGGNYFDIMNFHTYPVFAENWTGKKDSLGGPGLLEKTNYIRNKLAGYGLQKPMIVTEAGWFSDDPPNYPLPNNPDIQARYLVQLFTQAMAADLDIMIWWMLHDAGIGYNDTGLVTNGTPPVRKPAFFVYRNMAKEMYTTQFNRKLSLAETGHQQVEAYLFNDPVKQRQLYIAWRNPAYDNTTHPLRLPVAQATVKSIEGTVLYTVADGSDGVLDGHVTIQVSGRPVYIEVKH
jgi:hypothetical protein